MVDARESQILEGALAQELKERLECSLRRASAGADLVEQGAELLPVHCAKRLVVDLRPNWTVICSIGPRDGFISL